VVCVRSLRLLSLAVAAAIGLLPCRVSVPLGQGKGTVCVVGSHLLAVHHHHDFVACHRHGWHEDHDDHEHRHERSPLTSADVTLEHAAPGANVHLDAAFAAHSPRGSDFTPSDTLVVGPARDRGEVPPPAATDPEVSPLLL
jgi:hypothetical protein